MMFIVDNQLPLALARHLVAAGLECIHVQEVKLDAAEDAAIWQFAKERHGVIITKDEDFQALAIRQGNIPPQVVWIRLGNCRKLVLLEVFSRILPALREAMEAGESIIEVR